MGAGIVAVAPSAAVEDQPRGGESGLGRRAHVQHVWGQGQRLTRARAVDVPQAPVDAVRDAGADVYQLGESGSSSAISSVTLIFSGTETFSDASSSRALVARSAHTVAAQGDSMPPEPPLDEAYSARMLEGITRRGYIPASLRPSR